MRGKGFKIRFVNGKFRITPAYAGKRYRMEQRFPECQDHPRLCGEKFNCFPKFRSGLGSPPPMRGKGVFGIAHLRPTGITPAYAGKSQFSINIERNRRDHPRLCGEKISTFASGVVDSGSPPPMRGKVRFLVNHDTSKRITPAYAGKRSQFENLGNTE